MLSESSASALSSKLLRGWSILGIIFASIISDDSLELIIDSSSMSLSNAPKPLPKPPFLTGDIITSAVDFV